jgi:hypothetical protein
MASITYFVYMYGRMVVACASIFYFSAYGVTLGLSGFYF